LLHRRRHGLIVRFGLRINGTTRLDLIGCQELAFQRVAVTSAVVRRWSSYVFLLLLLLSFVLFLFVLIIIWLRWRSGRPSDRLWQALGFSRHGNSCSIR
jgi:hypothetical protein